MHIVRMCEGNRITPRKPTQALGECANFTQTVASSRNHRFPHQHYCETRLNETLFKYLLYYKIQFAKFREQKHLIYYEHFLVRLGSCSCLTPLLYVSFAPTPEIPMHNNGISNLKIIIQQLNKWSFFSNQIRKSQETVIPLSQ